VPNKGLVLDTGPLVAYLDPDERYHGWVCGQMSQIDGPLISCEPVLTEAFFFCVTTHLRLRPSRSCCSME